MRALLLLALVLAAPADAQTTGGNDANAPVSWSAEHVELVSRADRVALTGNVKIMQGAMKLDADRVIVAYSHAPGPDQPAPEINRVDASGNVVFTRGDQVAHGNMAIYDLDQRVVTMLGNVELDQGTNKMNGGRLVIDLDSGFSTIDGRSTAPGAAGGRVTATFNPPQRKTP